MTRAAIVGAGIGGLSTALALHQRGIEVVLVEQAARLEAVGAGIQLSPNANRVLSRLGVLDSIVGSSFEPQSLDIVDGHRGRPLLSAPLAGWIRGRHGQPYLNVHRGDLQTVLRDAVTAAMPGALLLGFRVTALQERNNAVTVRAEDGRTVNADVVIGADGVHSAVRAYVLSTAQPARFTGHVAYRMLVRRSAIPAASMPEPAVTLWMGPHGHIVSYWVRQGDLYNVVAIVEDDTWRDDGWRSPADASDVEAAFRGWDPRLQTLFGVATDVHKWALLDRTVPPSWSRGRVALLGDACHAMMPYLAQGAAMAVEDAWVLADALAGEPETVEALARYSRSRVGRATRVHTTARRNARTFHLSRRTSRFMRDTTLRALAGNPHRFVARMDWLYGFGPTDTGGEAT